jgi:hypothetical protein
VGTNDWPGRERAESLRQWSVIEGLATRAADVAWKISELKEAVRRGLREDREKS